MAPTDLAALENLSDDLTVVIIAVVAVLGTAWLLITIMKLKSAPRLDPNETAVLEQMTRIAQRMDNRLAAVERILDAETPAWRNSTDQGGRYESHPR